jgi:hemerythrin-like metal-binding protein
MTIQWKDSYKIGDTEIDADPHRLFELARKLVVAQDLETVRALAMDLYKHTRLHFEHEEGAMSLCNYPGLVSHVEMHNHMLGRLNAICQDIGKGLLDKAALDALMNDWAMKHIPYEDTRFEVYLQQDA